MTLLRAHVRVFFKVYCRQVSSFQLIAGSTLVGFLYSNVFSLTGASPLASAKSIYCDKNKSGQKDETVFGLSD